MLELLLGLSVVVNRVVETVKKTLATANWFPERWRPLAVLITQLITGVVVVAFSGQNIEFFPEGYVDKTVEIIIVGLVVSFGSEAVHIFVDIAKRLRFEEKNSS